ERPEPYRLVLELARGEINQVRNQIEEWRGMGMQIADDLEARLQLVHREFSRAVSAATPDIADDQALAALAGAFEAANRLIQDYVEQIISARHVRQPRLETLLGCYVNGAVPESAGDALAAAVNSVSLAMTWRMIEPAEAQYRWDETESALA